VSDGLLVAVFLVSALVSLGSSWVLVSRLERVGARLGLSEALLGVLAALAADAPEITAAVTAIGGHQSGIGAGVVIGSNVFNLAALLGVAAVLAGRIALHRRVVVLDGVVALWIAAVCLVVVIGLVSSAAGLGFALAVLGPYLVALGVRRSRLRRLGLPSRWVNWLTSAIVQEELELEVAIHPQRGRRRDALVAVAAVLVVVGTSVAMEQAVSTLGQRHAIPQIVVGGLILAAVTSLPNAIAGVYLARRGRGAATLSTAMNSNALNVTVGLLLPGAIVGLGAPSGPVTLTAVWYLALTGFALVTAYLGSGLLRVDGALILYAYVAFSGVVLSTAYSSSIGRLLSIAIPATAAIASTPWLLRKLDGHHERSPAETVNPPQTNSTLDEGIAAITRRRQMDSDGRAPNKNGAEGMPPGHSRPENESLLAGWSITRVWYLAIAISSLIAITDAILGTNVVLIGLLIAGPCCALLTGRWARTGVAGAWATALAVLLGLPDGIWGTTTHFVFLAAVVIVALVSTSSAAIIERHR
jgi:cation:H+ antiporter